MILQDAFIHNNDTHHFHNERSLSSSSVMTSILVLDADDDIDVDHDYDPLLLYLEHVTAIADHSSILTSSRSSNHEQIIILKLFIHILHSFFK
jgi:hypothetical protein